jgi:hypothetical protein
MGADQTNLASAPEVAKGMIFGIGVAASTAELSERTVEREEKRGIFKAGLWD